MNRYVFQLTVLTVCFILTAALVSLAGTAEGNNVKEKKPFLISTDVAVDDWLAILYMLRHPRVEVKGVTVCGNGIATCGPGVRNAQGLFALGWPWNIPVTCGQPQPLKYNHTFPAKWRRDCDNLVGLSLPSNPFPPSTLTAVDLIIETVKKSPKKMNILALGPLTDLAQALQKAPAVKKNLEMIYIMGGAVNTGGNLQIPGVTNIDNPYAEWNIYIDPAAADMVFKSGVPITLVPLDACNDVPMDMNFYKDMVQNHITPQADFVLNVLGKNLDLICSDHYFLWDPLAAVIAADKNVAEMKRMRLKVITEKGKQCGRTVISDEGAWMQVCTAADNGKVKKRFIDVLNGKRQ